MIEPAVVFRLRDPDHLQMKPLGGGPLGGVGGDEGDPPGHALDDHERGGDVDGIERSEGHVAYKQLGTGKNRRFDVDQLPAPSIVGEAADHRPCLSFVNFTDSQAAPEGRDRFDWRQS